MSIDKALAEKISKAKKLGAVRNYLKPFTEGTLDVLQVSMKNGYTGRSFLVKVVIVESRSLDDRFPAHKPMEVSSLVWKPDEVGKKGEMQLGNIITFISEALGGGDIEVTADDIESVGSEEQPLRGIRLKYWNKPSAKEIEAKAAILATGQLTDVKSYPRLTAHPDNSETTVAARRADYDKTHPIEKV